MFTGFFPIENLYLKLELFLALRIWTSFWRRDGSTSMDTGNAPMVQSRQPLTYRLMESMGLGSRRWHRSSWQKGIAESGSSQLWTLMIDIPGDLVWDLPYVQQASYLEGGPLMWRLPLYLHVNQKFVDDDQSVHWLYNKITVDYWVIEYDVISTGEYQYWPSLSLRSILVFSNGHHIIFTDSMTNNCIMLLCKFHVAVHV